MAKEVRNIKVNINLLDYDLAKEMMQVTHDAIRMMMKHDEVVAYALYERMVDAIDKWEESKGEDIKPSGEMGYGFFGE